MKNQLFTVRKSNGYVIVYIKGRIDVTYANQLEESFEELIREGHYNLILNLKDVDYMSSSGFRVYISLLRQVKNHEGQLKLCCLKNEVKRVFDIIELSSLFDTYATEKDAIASFKL